MALDEGRDPKSAAATWMKVYDEKLRAPPALSEAAVRSQMMFWGRLKAP